MEKKIFQSTRPVRGATSRPLSRGEITAISIHAPRAGRDLPWSWWLSSRCISIHAPHVGRDPQLAALLTAVLKFQSTRPMWGATLTLQKRDFQLLIFQSTRPMWGATPVRTIEPV